MANGLAGKLTLDTSGVMKAIDSLKDLERAVANIGKGAGGRPDISNFTNKIKHE